ncbi:MAG: hypothetical protein CR971_01630 [candidate division SR1 bacterium]|nr:MAG: hypothetical protein CR971_01630 [candidate division SR1 bacterium]
MNEDPKQSLKITLPFRQIESVSSCFRNGALHLYVNLKDEYLKKISNRIIPLDGEKGVGMKVGIFGSSIEIDLYNDGDLAKNFEQFIQFLRENTDLYYDENIFDIKWSDRSKRGDDRLKVTINHVIEQEQSDIEKILKEADMKLSGKDEQKIISKIKNLELSFMEDSYAGLAFDMMFDADWKKEDFERFIDMIKKNKSTYNSVKNFFDALQNFDGKNGNNI